MKTKMNIWIFLGIAGIVLSLSVSADLLSIRINSIEFSAYSVVLRLFSLFAFIISFFLTSLCIKNRKHILWFCLLYAFAFALPSLMKTRGTTLMGGGHERLFYSVYSFLTVLVNSSYAIMLYLGYDWFNKQKRIGELEKQRVQSELRLLKNQINPHFLFNTLNNIDSLIKRNPDYASASIIELSDMMRYMIYETNVDQVSLKRELDYIESYLGLQKLQYANSDLVDYSVTGRENPEKIQIAPMLFTPFIENAFKHCTHKDLKHAIRFYFRLEPNIIHFEAVNHADKKMRLSKDSSHGIGLETVKRRLEILYPERYSLQIQEKNDLFCASLMIRFND